MITSYSINSSTTLMAHLLQNELEIPIPHYFTSENAKILKERDKMLGTILAKMGPQDTTVVRIMYAASITPVCISNQGNGYFFSPSIISRIQLFSWLCLA